MHIESKTASLAWKVLVVAIGLAALLEQIGLFSGVFEPTFFCYFTNISNIAVVAYFCGAVVAIVRGRDAHNPWLPKLKYALMLAITVTFLVAHFLLNGGMVFVDGRFQWPMLVLHYLVPIGTILDWLLFDAKGHMEKRDPLTWPAFPLAYLVYIVVLVECFGVSARGSLSRWPYPFIDVDLLGVPAVCGIVVALVVFFVALGYAYRALDVALAKKAAGK